MGLGAMNYRFRALEVTRIEFREVGSDEARNLRSCEQLKNMKIEVKIKETRWGKIRILD